MRQPFGCRVRLRLVRRTTFVYDALGREIQQIDPLNKSVTFAYDAAGYLVSRTDSLGRPIDFSFDVVGRKTGETWVSAGNTVNILTFTVPSRILVAFVAEFRWYGFGAAEGRFTEFSRNLEEADTTAPVRRRDVAAPHLVRRTREWFDRAGVSEAAAYVAC